MFFLDRNTSDSGGASRSRLVVAALATCLVLWGTSGRAEMLDLEGCVRRALSVNPELLDLVDARHSAALGLEVPLAEYRLQAIPTIRGGFQGDNRTNQEYRMLFRRKLLTSGTELEVSGGTSAFSAIPQATIPYLSETRVTVAQPILQGWGGEVARERIDDARRRQAAAGHGFEGGRHDLGFRVIGAYYEVIRAGELAGVTDRSIDRVGELVGIARAKLEIGAVSKMDVYRAELQIARLRAGAVEQRARRESALDALKILLGMSPSAKLSIESRTDSRFHPTELDRQLEGAESIALERRIELREARGRVRDGERKLRVARNKVWPAIDLFGSYARQGVGSSFDDSLQLDREEWGVGLRSTVALDRTAERVAAKEAEIALRGLSRDLVRIEAEIVRQVRAAHRGVELASTALELAGEISAQADAQVELARFRYEKGVTDNSDLVQAEIERSDSRGAYVLAALERDLAVASLRRASGTLLDLFDVDGFPDAPSFETLEAP